MNAAAIPNFKDATRQSHMLFMQRKNSLNQEALHQPKIISGQPGFSASFFGAE